MSAVLMSLVAVHPAALAAQTIELRVPLPELEAIAARDSADPVAHYNVGLGYWVHGRLDDAERALRRAVAIEPGLAGGYLALAYVPYARRPKLWKEVDADRVPPEWRERVGESRRLFRRAFLMDPLVDLRVYGLVMPPRERLVIGRNATATYAALVRGFESFWGGNHAAALWSLNEVRRKVFPKDEDVPDVILWYQGLAAAHVQYHELAIANFRLLLERRLREEEDEALTLVSLRSSNDLRYVLAVLLQRAGRLDEAIPLFEEVLANNLGQSMAHVRLAEIRESRVRWPPDGGDEFRPATDPDVRAALTYFGRLDSLLAAR